MNIQGEQLKSSDEQHLDYLKIGYYISGAIIGLFSLIPIVHVVIGTFIAFGSFETEGNPPPAWMGGMFIGIGLTLIVLGMTMAVLNFVVARSIANRTRYTFCLVVAGLIAVISIPLGTLLGVFTFIVLLRDPVKAMFGKE